MRLIAGTAEHRALVRALSVYMSEISESSHCAGWLDGLEYDLWRIVQQGHVATYGQSVINEEQIETMRTLSELLDGWAMFNSESESGCNFVQMERWLQLVAEHEIDRRYAAFFASIVDPGVDSPNRSEPYSTLAMFRGGWHARDAEVEQLRADLAEAAARASGAERAQRDLADQLAVAASRCVQAEQARDALKGVTSTR